MSVDYVEAVPGAAGLYSNGLEILSRRMTVTGATRVQCRYHFALYRVSPGQQDNLDAALWLMELQAWVHIQSILRQAPTFGDEPLAESIRAEKGRLKENPASGTGKYVVMLTVDFVKNYE